MARRRRRQASLNSGRPVTNAPVAERASDYGQCPYPVRTWAWRSWCGANRRRIPAWAARRRSSLRTAALEALDHGRPRVGPSITQSIGRTGSSTHAVSRGRGCSQPQASIPISRRRPPLPLRTSRDPRCGSRSVRSGSAPPGCHLAGAHGLNCPTGDGEPESREGARLARHH
jgi:hypothetical protein